MFRFPLFSFALGVGSSCGRGGFVFAFNRPSASYSDHYSKLTTFKGVGEIGVAWLPRLKSVSHCGGFVFSFSRSGAPQSYHSAKLTTYQSGDGIGVV